MSRDRNLNGDPRVILFLGAPGSGKGTQSLWLSRQLGVPCLSTGDALRSRAAKQGASDLPLREILASGSLVSDEIVCEVVGERVREEAQRGGIILDGFPRTVDQAAYLDRQLFEMALPGPLVIHLDVSRDLLLRRLTARRHCVVCGTVYNLLSRRSTRGPRCENDGGLLVDRDDDTPGVVLRRLEKFEASATMLMNYYRDADFHRIDGDGDPQAVAAELMQICERFCVPA